ncbi:MAG: PhnD/SsuA/transferrin family substrate-binding protein, partial [Pseudomonadota bacterium]
MSMGLLASLPMYARPELDKANAALWTAIKEALKGDGIDAPQALTPDGLGYAFWEDPKMLFSQTCGFPYRARLRDKVHLIGTPDYGLSDCPPGYYYSVFVVRKGRGFEGLSDLDGTAFAFNDMHSQSGYHGPLSEAAMHGITFSSRVETGGHWRSAKTVVEGRADVAAIDAVTWRHMTRFDDFTCDLEVVAKTAATPGLPFISAIDSGLATIK